MTMSLSTGLISGMDTGSLVAQLVQAEAAPQAALKARLKTTQDTVSAYQTINTTFLAVTAAAEAALKPDAWTPIKATSSAAGVAVSATAGALSGSLTFTVKQLAASHAVMNTNPGVWTSSTSLYGATEIEVSDENNAPLTPKITIGGTGTLADAAAAINASSHGLTAAVVQISTGEAALRITAKDTGAASKFGLTGTGTFTVNTAAADAKIEVGTTSPIAMTSATNTFDSVMPGATFTVSKVDEVATLTIASDPNAVAAKMQTLIDAVNSAAKNARDYTSNSVGSKAALNGDYAVGSLVGKLLDAVSFAVKGVGPGGTDVSPATMGFQLSKDGKTVAFDRNVFLNALKADPTLAQKVVGGTAAGVGPDELTGTADDVAATGIAGRLLAVAKGASDSTTGSLVALAKGQESLVKGYEDRIAAWDLRLAKRKEALTRQFTAMETALSSLRNQSTWLAGQINQLSAG